MVHEKALAGSTFIRYTFADLHHWRSVFTINLLLGQQLDVVLQARGIYVPSFLYNKPPSLVHYD